MTPDQPDAAAARDENGNYIRFEASVGQWVDYVSLGTFDNRDEAVQAIGQWALDGSEVEYPAIHEIVQL